MNTLSVFNPWVTSRLFDVLDSNAGFTRSDVSLPQVDVKEHEDRYTFQMDLPGYSEKDVELNIKDRLLTIASKKVEETNEESADKEKTKDEGQWLIRERRSLSFTRRFTLPEDIDQEKVHAEFENGVLSIMIPRKPESQSRAIAIKSKKAS